MLAYVPQVHKPVSTASGAVAMVIHGLRIYVKVKLFHKKKFVMAPTTIAMER